MDIIADLEVHSKYARAVSSSMNVVTIAKWALKKGIDLVGTGDFTHPMWLRELEASLEEVGEGIFKFKSSSSSTRFLLTSEVSCIYSHKGKGRRVHLLVYLPNFESVHKFNESLSGRGANLFSDGRPIMGLSLKQVAEIALSANDRALLIPAHVWTPWFGFYGSMSGYDSLSDAFEDFEKYIPAVETGLSSDPAMNWRIEELAGKSIVSFGDAHSPQKLGREATVFKSKIRMPNSKSEINYQSIYDAIWGKPEGDWEIGYTIEFYPEEGKYHYTGHRKCGVIYSPNEARKMGLSCPVCGKALTMGVASRVEGLASREIQNDKLQISNDKFGVQWIRDEKEKHPPYVMLVPLLEILSEVFGSGFSSQQVVNSYEQLVSKFGSEFEVLLKTSLADLSSFMGERVSEAIKKVRGVDIFIEPGYDGVFGKVKVWKEEKNSKTESEQASLF